MKPLLNRTRLLLALAGLVTLTACDMLGVESASATAARREAEGKAIGGACRHAGRAIEDCYGLNRKADKAAVFAGWREMNDYMRENKIEAVPPSMQRGGGKSSESDTEATEKPAPAASEPKAKPKRPS
jgi:hypothetical protein